MICRVQDFAYLRVLLLCFALIVSPQTAAVAADTKAATPVFITLGTGGGPMIRKSRAQPANALLVGDAIYLFDVGDGVLQQMARAGLDLGKVRAIFISHHHIDHDAGLGSVLSSRWLFGLVGMGRIPVVGPPGTIMQVEGIGRAFHPAELAPVQVGGPEQPLLQSTVAAQDIASEMNVPTLIYEDKNIRVIAITNDHFHFLPGSEARRFSRSYSYRIEANGKSIVFTGDTGPSANLERLAHGADMLVSEVVDLDQVTALLRASPLIAPNRLPSLVAHMKEDHLQSTDVARIAANAKVGAVVLTHFVPGTDDAAEGLAGYTRGMSAIYQGPIHMASDLDRFTP